MLGERFIVILRANVAFCAFVLLYVQATGNGSDVEVRMEYHVRKELQNFGYDHSQIRCAHMCVLPAVF